MSDVDDEKKTLDTKLSPKLQPKSLWPSDLEKDKIFWVALTK